MEKELSNLENLAKELFPFAYSLIPDELMAGQLIIDAILRMVIETEDIDSITFEITKKKKYCRNILKLAIERGSHAMYIEKNDFFYKELSIEHRAVIFLADKWNWNMESIHNITGLKREELHLKLQEARGLMAAEESLL